MVGFSFGCHSAAPRVKTIKALKPVWLRDTPSSNLKGHLGFDAGVWQLKPRKFGNYTRWLMLSDLRERYLGKLDSDAHVRSLLGKPDDTENDSGLNYLIYHAYAEGSASPMKPDIAFEVDPKGTVRRIAVYFDHQSDSPSEPWYKRAFGPNWKPQGADIN